MKIICWFLLLVWPVWQAGASEVTPKVVFIIVDGIPADVLEKVRTPSIDAISGDSGYTRAYVGGEIGGESESPTVSSVGYHSLITGTWANKHNVWSNDIKAPNYQYWDIFRIAKNHDAALCTAVFSTWEDNRTKLIGDGLPQAGGKKIDHHVDGLEKDTQQFPHDFMSGYIRDIDQRVTAAAAAYIAKNGPDLTWVYLQYTDDVGHRFGDGDAQLAAVELMDARVGEIWRSVSQRQQGFAEDWLVIVTTDHGRDSRSGRGHGGQSERERTTWIATNSKNLNNHFSQTPAIVDILPSIAAHLELTIPKAIAGQLDGQSFVD
jgi:predicted AlkP superfamily pyrophosphatase or phosphodiesterase